MQSSSLETAVRRIRSLTVPVDTQTDGDLLGQFRSSRDNRAFATLVARHGPAVLGVCRRIMNDSHAADDAFQATFLVLARRAKSIRNAASLGCWLHGVAVRVAMKHKGRLARQPRTVESVESSAIPRDDVLWRDVRRVLDEEVNRLPERLRLPVFLCYFEGKTRDEAAETLGWKLTTLRGRLEDGRLRLRTRLALRGVELAAALLAISASEGLAVTESLLESTGQAACGVATSTVQSLAKGVAMSGTIATAKVTVATLLLALGLGTTILVYRGQAGEVPLPGFGQKSPEPVKEKESPPAAKSVEADGWGEAVEGVRARLRIKKTKLLPGEPITFELDLKNEGAKTWKLLPIPFQCEVEVDKTWYSYSGMFEYKTPEKELKPGGELIGFLTVTTDKNWAQTPRLDRWSDVWQRIALKLLPGKHQVRVAFPMSKTVRPMSNTVEIEVAADEWGEAVEGVKARLRIKNTKLKPGEALTFELDLKNEGSKTWQPIALPFACEVLVGQLRYGYLGPIDYKASSKDLKPAGELVPFVTATADKTWTTRTQEEGATTERPPMPLNLPPGKYQVRVDFPVSNTVRPISNTVEIEVEPAPLDPQVRAMALAADRIWVVPSPTREKPVPAPLEALKGPLAQSPDVFDLRLLSGTDPAKKWIVFLKADEEGKPSPNVQLMGPQWSLPFDAATVEGIRQVILPTEWGTPNYGYQMGIRLRQADVAANGPVMVEVSIRNVTDEPRPIFQHRFNIYDYWPRTTFEVEAPSGRWLLSKPEGAIKRLDVPARIILKPGETYTQSMRLDQWDAHRMAPKEGTDPKRVFAVPGEYAITAQFVAATPTVGVDPARIPPLTSNAAKLSIAKDPPWGQAVGGMQARVRLAKATFKAGEPLVFELDLKNSGTETYEDTPVSLNCRIELDGDEFQYTGPSGNRTATKKLPPGKAYVPYFKVETNESWTRLVSDRSVPLVLTPGKHTIRVSYPLPDKLKPVSPAIEFEVDEVKDPDLAALVEAADRIVVTTIEWRTGNTGRQTEESRRPKPYVYPTQTLKGPEFSNKLVAVTGGADPLPEDRIPRPDWIMFLKAEEDGAVPPRLTPAVARQWFRRATPGDIAAIQKLLLKPTDLGTAKDGLALGLRPAKSTVTAGENMRLEVVLVNQLEKDIRISQQRMDGHDWWPHLTFMVTRPDGFQVTLKHDQTINSDRDPTFGHVRVITIKPNDLYAHVVRLNNWAVEQPKKADELPLKLFEVPGTYKVEAKYTRPLLKDELARNSKDPPVWSGELTSNVVTIEVKPETK